MSEAIGVSMITKWLPQTTRMPGIAGLITSMPRARAEAQLAQMLSPLQHEPSYCMGTWTESSLGLYVGWVARKGSFSEAMPLHNETRDRTLVFSGEEYPEPGTATRLKAHGHELNGSRASCLVHVSEEDSAFPASLNGRFHGVLADRRQGQVRLFNDRYGLQRLYYHESNDCFYFAAEAKSILAALPELRATDERGLGEFLGCGCALENRTIFKGISVLPAGSAWLFEGKQLRQRAAYFDPREWAEQSPLSPEEYYADIREVFARNLPRYFEGEPAAISLTGGLDSRMILAWHKSEPGSLPCYSFGGPFRDSQDVLVAREVARVYGQPFQVIPVRGEFLSRFSHYAERTVYLTDGAADVSCSPDLHTNRIAAQIAPVRMTGNYGGEVLRSVRAFKPSPPPAGLFAPEVSNQIQQAADTYTSLLATHPLSFAVFRQAPWHHFGRLALEQSQLVLRSPFLDNDLVKTVFRAPAAACANSDVCLRLIADGDAALRRLPTDRGPMPDQVRWHHKLRRQFQEFTFKAEYAYDYGMPQWLARADHALSRFHLERLFLGRHKFYHFRLWYRDPLAAYVQEMLLDSRALGRPYLNRQALRTMVEQHVKGTHNHTTAIHKALTLELVHRLLLDSH